MKPTPKQIAAAVEAYSKARQRYIVSEAMRIALTAAFAVEDKE